MALIEAMATCLPAIASNVSGNAEVIEQGRTGILFSVGEINELATGLIALMENTEYRNTLSQNGYARVMEKFSLPKAMKQYLALYE